MEGQGRASLTDEAGILAIPIHEIVIRSGLDEDGSQTVCAKFLVEGTEAQLIPYVEGLGLLEAAKQNFIDRWNAADVEDE